MKIKLAIVDNDERYLGRISTAFNQKYADKLRVYSFTNVEALQQTMTETRFDVVLVSEYFEIDTKQLPEWVGFAYLVDSADIDTLNNQQTVCKFQKIDLIYKQILSIFAENTNSIIGTKGTETNCKMIAVCSPSGGSGVTSISAAIALRLAAEGHKTLYLNLESLGASETFFSGEGQFDMSDVIFALKSKRTNLGMKLESCVRQDRRGVYFFAAPKLALDMTELKTEEILRLITDILLTGSYEYIVADFDFNMTDDFLNLLSRFHAILLTGTGSEISNCKIFRLYNSLVVREETNGMHLMERMSLIYNKFSNKTGKIISDIELKNIGGIPRFEHATDTQVIEQIARMAVLDKIIP